MKRWFKARGRHIMAWALVAPAVGAGAYAVAQSNTTTESLNATRSIAGSDVIPAPNPTFGGTIDKNAADSTPWWPPKLVAPARAPNVLVVLLDDAGFAATSTFGGADPHARARRSREARPALHQLPRHRDVFADARRAA